MRIDWTKQRCNVCGGRFEPGHTTQIYGQDRERAGQLLEMGVRSVQRRRLSTEQYLAMKG